MKFSKLCKNIGAASIKDLGKVMAALREHHGGVLDLGRAGTIVRRLLG